MFIDDSEKMKDFVKLTKKEFLESYSYLTEKEYDETAQTLLHKCLENYNIIEVKDLCEDTNYGYILLNAKSFLCGLGISFNKVTISL